MGINHRTPHSMTSIDRETHGHEGNSDTGRGYKRVENTEYQSKIVASGGYTYICKSLVGTAEATAGWQVKRIEDSTGSIMYADADLEYDNAATDPTLLTYSYS